jgi:hypothetical protein
MNTTEIENLLRSDCKLSTIFEGVFASDCLPSFCAEETAIVMNLDPHDRSGSHWVCLYIENGKGEYFDSYGYSPVDVNFVNFLNRNCPSWKFNDKEFQALDSDVCGHYCIWYLSERARGLTMDEIKNQFDTRDCNKNDAQVKENVEVRFGSIAMQVSNTSTASNKIMQCCMCRKR